jgi:hypothetical protein
MKKSCIAILIAAGFLSIIPATRAGVIADWTFETSQPSTAGPFSPEIGSGSASGSHAGASVYSTPAGNGSFHSFSSTLWAVGDYYQFSVSTLGLSNVGISFDQASSNTGPGLFAVQYSTDGTSFTTFGSNYSVLANASPNPLWNTNTTSSLFTSTVDLSSVTALNNDSTIFIRLVDTSTTSASGGTVGTGGTDRVDNFIVTAVSAVPEPSALALSGLAGIFGMVRILRRKS